MDSKQVHLYQISPEELKSDFLLGVDAKLKKYFEKYPPIKNEDDELMTVDETIKFLKCSKQALYNWRKNGILPSFRLGNRVYYRKSDIFSKLVKQE
ncbi:MAG: helix-turn-helix domain-containing protein [Algicola sp.]|nr:helix-turn-helix domain-containing protein [Algicola sp.]